MGVFMKNFSRRLLVLLAIATTPLVAMDRTIKKVELYGKDIGIDILKQTAKKNSKKMISSFAPPIALFGSTLIAINSLDKDGKYSSKDCIWETVLRAMEITSTLKNRGLCDLIKIKSIEVPFDKRPKTSRFMINRYLKNHDVGLESTIMDTVNDLLQETTLGLISTECGIRSIQKLTRLFSAPDDQKLPYLVCGLCNAGISAGIMLGSKGFFTLKKETVSLDEQGNIKKFEKIVADFLKNIATCTIMPLAAKWTTFITLSTISVAGATYGMKTLLEATKEVNTEQTSTPKSIGKFVWGSFLLGGSIVTMVNLEGLSDFSATTKSQAFSLSPVKDASDETGTLISSKIDNHLSLKTPSSYLFDNFL
jgi:hypothetical protein